MQRSVVTFLPSNCWNTGAYILKKDQWISIQSKGVLTLRIFLMKVAMLVFLTGCGLGESVQDVQGSVYDIQEDIEIGVEYEVSDGDLDAHLYVTNHHTEAISFSGAQHIYWIELYENGETMDVDEQLIEGPGVGFTMDSGETIKGHELTNVSLGGGNEYEIGVHFDSLFRIGDNGEELELQFDVMEEIPLESEE